MKVRMNQEHYELPLLFKTDDVHLSNNHCQALKRLQHVKHKMRRNPKFTKHYTEFMENIFPK